jgi:phosphotransferase system HPr (HPr) family protein
MSYSEDPSDPQEECYCERVLVQNRFGIHVRPSTRFVEIAQGFKAKIRVAVLRFEGQMDEIQEREEFDGKSVIQLLQLGASCGSELQISAQGEDAKQALLVLKKLVEDKFGFEE